MDSALERVPAHLRRHVVEQDYAAYDEIDQAVWRFTLRHTHAVLQHTAHPAYRRGLEQTGIDLERIPRLSEMDRRLAALGWGAVGVDGFIPPRAFQQLQAHGILPIAVDIRTVDHLAYTPAPDIIHEAAGHAPILADPEYGTFLRRIGEVGYRAFALPHDEAVYQAIYALSVIKERIDASSAQVRASEQALADAIAAIDGVSEAARVARLYWWTVEYGLIGTPEDYRIYGAGLLSSLGESHFCHAPQVAKLPLDAGCLDIDYDITRAQPQLFVAQSFAQLSDVLAEVEAGLSQARGGVAGLAQALASGEVATLRFANGLALSGRLSSFEQHEGAPIQLTLAPGWTAAEHDRPLADYGREDHRDMALLVWLTVASAESAPGTACQIALANGRHARGRISATLRGPSGRALAHAFRSRRVVATQSAESAWLVLPQQRIVSVAAGPAHADFFAAGPELVRTAPAPKPETPERRELLAMYERAFQAWNAQLGGGCIPLFEALHARLLEAHPREWLLRWNLLESLVKLGERSRLTQALVAELSALEHAFDHRQPIATGLRALGATTMADPRARELQRR